MFRHVPLILGNAVRNLRRSVITIASIGVSLCLLGILLAIYLGLFHAPDTSPAQALRVIVRHRVSLTRDLPISYLPKIRAVHGVKAVTSWQWFGGTYIEPKNFFARFGVDPKEFFEVYPDFEVTPEARDAFQQQRTACLAGEALAKKFKWQPNQRITLKGDIFPVNLELTMVGTFNDPDGGQLLLFNNQYLRDGLSGPRKDRVGTFMLTVNSPERVPGLSKEIDAMFANSPEPTRTESEKQFALSFVGFMGNLRLFLGAISGAVLFAILLVSANTIAMAVRERTRETGILRTLGYTPDEVMGMILGEAAVLAMVGGVVGAGMATVLTAATAAVARQMGIGFRIPTPGPPIWGVLMLSALVIGLLSALLPAYFASRRPVVESMRFTG